MEFDTNILLKPFWRPCVAVICCDCIPLGPRPIEGHVQNVRISWKVEGMCTLYMICVQLMRHLYTTRAPATRSWWDVVTCIRTSRLMSRPVSVSALLCHHRLSSDAPVFQPSAIELFRSPLNSRRRLWLFFWRKRLKTHLISCSCPLIPCSVRAANSSFRSF